MLQLVNGGKAQASFEYHLTQLTEEFLKRGKRDRVVHLLNISRGCGLDLYEPLHVLHREVLAFHNAAFRVWRAVEHSAWLMVSMHGKEELG